MEEFGPKESRKITVDILVKLIVGKHPEWKDPLNIEKFSDYVIKKVVGDFMNDPSVNGDHETKKNKAKELYTDILNAWEENYGADSLAERER